MQAIFLSILLALSMGAAAYFMCRGLFRLWRWLPCVVVWLFIISVIASSIVTSGWGALAAYVFMLVFTLPAVFIAGYLGMLTSFSFFLPGEKENGLLGFLIMFPVNYLCCWGIFLLLDYLTPGEGVGQEYFAALGISACSPSLVAHCAWNYQNRRKNAEKPS